MVVAIQKKYCPDCRTEEALHTVHEPCMGRPAKASCVVCLSLQVVDDEWPRLVWRKRPHNTFAVPKGRKA